MDHIIQVATAAAAELHCCCKTPDVSNALHAIAWTKYDFRGIGLHKIEQNSFLHASNTGVTQQCPMSATSHCTTALGVCIYIAVDNRRVA